MKIFRPAVKYGFVIAVVIGISLSYVNRYEWFPQIFKQARQDTGALPVTGEATAPSQPDQATGDTQVASPAVSSPEQATATDTGTSAAEVTTPPQSMESGTPSTAVQESGTREAPQSSASSSAQESTPGQQAEVPAAPSTSEPQKSGTSSAVQGPMPGEQAETPATPSTTSESQTGVQQPNAANEPAQAVDQYIKLLMNARTAFWQGNYDAAVDAYRKAEKLMPDNPDAYGELGNLYYSQGQWEQAGDAYYQAAQHLLDSGDIDRAAQLTDVVQGLAPDRAQELQKRIKSVVEQGSAK